MSNNNNKTLMNQPNPGTVSTQETAPIYVPKINLTGGPNNTPVPASPQSNVIPVSKKESKLGLVYSIVGFVLGILSLVAVVILGFFSIPMAVVGFAALVPYGIGIVTAIVGIVFSAMGRNRSDNTGLAKAGLVMNIIPLVALAALVTITIVGCAALMSCFALAFSQASQSAAAIF